METSAIIIVGSLIAATLIACVASFVASHNDAKAATTALDGMARQPEMQQKLLVSMLISIGLIESIPIIAIVIAIVLVFANPFL